MSGELDGRGTAEEQWQAWPEMQAWPALSVERPPVTVVAVAPHPDDEVLGIGGLLALLARAGSQIHLIAVTDGEASHPDSPTVTPESLAARRVRESEHALAALGVSPASVERLGLPDGQVGRGETRSATINAAVIHQLSKTAHLGDTWCLVPWPADGHPDHDATGEAAIRGASGRARIFTYPVWMWHWATPSDPRVPWSTARRIVLPADIRAAKEAAVAQFRTQIHPLSDEPADAMILPPHILRRLTRDAEIVFEAGTP